MNRWLIVWVSCAVLGGCSSPSTTADLGKAVDTGADQAEKKDSGEIKFKTDLVEARPAPETLAEVVDVGTPDIHQLQCDPGEGCFLDKCTDNSQCQSGWCVEHMGDGVCTKVCQEECPQGWSCKQVGGDGPDVVWVCVSNHPNLCRPCAEADHCAGVAGTEDACVAYGDQGSFCGGKCGEDGQCPWGFECQTVNTVDGIELDQCVAETGDCPCTDTSAELGLFTPCQVTNDFGTCDGKRVCEKDGLSDCDATLPASEACNGIDDDCDGDLDEGTCDDDNQCTEDSCQGEDGCLHLPQDAGECMDDNPCTKADHCEQGVCFGEFVDCDDGNPCTDDYCTELGGCEHENNYEACDDEDPCTLGDECKGGECVGIQFPCDCLVDQDCAELEDGNMCNGTLFCDTAKLPYACKVFPDSLIECPAPEGPNAICLKAQCSLDTGECSFAPDHEGFPCEDGGLCTLGDKCVEGVCTAGMQVNCNDGNPCTADSCIADSGCVHENNVAPCNDGNLCTAGDACGDGACVPGAEKSCDDGNTCTDDGCDPETGCTHLPNKLECDDDNGCTLGDHCAAGWCTFSGLKSCNDGNPCTDDACDTEAGCTHANNVASCDDGNPCSTGDHCEGGGCVSEKLLDCDDNNVCTGDMCSEDGKCQNLPVPGPCDDGDACTAGDHCSSGQCANLGVENCDDGNVCTDDSCDVNAGCLHIINEDTCDDGDPCTAGDKCNQGICQGAEDVDCDDENMCTVDECVPGVGCQSNELEEDTPCGPKAGWACQEGECLCKPDCDNTECGDDGCGGTCGECDDGLYCTEDTCEQGACGHSTLTYHCLIDEECVPGGSFAPNNLCKFCNPDLAQDDWSVLADGVQCGTGKLCHSGNCCDPVANCASKDCGPDGCGGSCGECPVGSVCGAEAVCVPSHVWSKRLGGSGSDSGSVVPAEAGAYYVLGTFWHSGATDFADVDLSAGGSEDIFLAKLEHSGEQAWCRGFGGKGSDRARGGVAMAEERLYIGGSFKSAPIEFDNHVLNSKGDNDAFIAAVEFDGQVLWAKGYGGTEYDNGMEPILTSQGEILVGIESESPELDMGCGELPHASEKYDMVVGKLTAAGDCVWSHRFAGHGSLQSILPVPDGGFFLLGRFFGDAIDLGGGLINSAGSSDVFVAKFNSDGVHLWSRLVGGDDDETPKASVLLEDGSLVVTGEFESSSADFGGLPLTGAGETDVFVVKYGGTGEHLWSRSFGGANHEFARDIGVSPQGTVTLAGAFRSSSISLGDKEFLSSGKDDLMVVSLDQNGEFQWASVFGGASDEYPTRCAVGEDGAIYLAGYFISPFLDLGGGELGNDNIASNNVFMAKLDPSGQHVWSRTFGDWYNEYPSGIGLDSNGHVVLWGTFHGATFDMGGQHLHGKGNGDFFVGVFSE